MTRQHLMVVAALCVGAAAGTQQAQAPAPGGPFRFAREVVPGGAGPNRLDLDATVLAAGQPFVVGQEPNTLEGVAANGLGDLRLFDEHGAELPYLLVDPPSPRETWTASRPRPTVPGRTTSGFEVDLAASVTVDRLRVEGLPAGFQKRVRLDASGDRTRWTRLVDEGSLFDLPDQGLSQLELWFEPGQFRYLRLTWDDRNSGRLPLPRSASVRQAGASEPASRLRIPLALSRRPSEPGRSRFRLGLPSPRLPVVALDFEVPDGYLSRKVIVTEAHLAGRAVEPRTLGTALLVNDPRTPPASRRLRVAIEPPRETELHVEVEDGDNPPLAVDAVTAECAPLPWVYFEARSSGPLVARYGNSGLRAPTYDLEAARARIEGARTVTARWGEARALPATAEAPVAPLPIAAGPKAPIEGFRYRRAIAPGPAQLVAVPLDAAVLAHSSYSLAGYGLSGEFADLRVLDDQHRQVPYLVERLAEPQAVPVILAPASGAAARPGETIYELTLPVRGLAPSTLVLRTSARVFRREIRVEVPRAADARHRDAWVETLASTSWRHDSPDAPAPGVALTLSQFAGDTSKAQLVVMEGDNAPLPISSAELLLPAYRVRFYRPPGVPLTLAYGDPTLAAPEYDLALLGATVLGAAATEVGAGPEQDAAPAGTSPVVPPAAFWAVLALAALALGWLIVTLVRRGEA